MAVERRGYSSGCRDVMKVVLRLIEKLKKRKAPSIGIALVLRTERSFAAL